MILEENNYLLIKVIGKPAPQGSKIRTRYGMREASEYVAPWRSFIDLKHILVLVKIKI